MKYTSIKKTLKKQIETNQKVFWTYNENNKEFICIYKHFDDKLKIYTPQQLLDYLDEIQMHEV
jgi:hypothetical protein